MHSLILFFLIFFLFLFLLFLGEEVKLLNYPLDKKELKEIHAVIKGAVEDNSWWEAKSKEEIRNTLDNYYGGLLLRHYVNNTWNFVASPTDWYSKACLINISTIYSLKKIVFVDANLEIADSITNYIENGEAKYIIIKTTKGWRIFLAYYQWPKFATKEGVHI